jgi:hypothetical protein
VTSEGEDQVNLQDEGRLAVLERHGHPALESEVLVNEIDESDTAEPLILVVDLEEVSAELEVPIE